MDAFWFVLDWERFVPRGHCGEWDRQMLVLYIVANIGIWSAYMAIPAILYFLTSDFNAIAKDPPIRWAFIVFIGSCGIGHLEGVLAFSYPTYHLYAIWDLGTAVVSWAAVGMLWGRHRTVVQIAAIREAARQSNEKGNA